MKTVYLVRHAKSSWSDPSLRDMERPLNKRGLRDAPFMSKLLKGKGVFPDKLVSSPAKRAFKTSRFFADAYNFDKEDIIKNRDIYEAGPRDIIRIIQEFDDAWQTVFLFGHNPTFTSVANIYSSDYIDNLPTCGVVQIEFSIDKWSTVGETNGQVKAFYYPKQYFN